MIKLDKKVKKIIYIILLYIVMFTASHYIRDYLEIDNQLKTRMYHNFQDFGTSLEELNDNIAQILVLDKYNFDKEKEFIDSDDLGSFWRSKFKASDLGKGKAFHDFDDIYSQMNTVIRNILEDGKLSREEKNYLQTLYNYNGELIEGYKEIMGEVYYEEWAYEKMSEIKKSIVEIYNQYSEKAENTLNSTEYIFLKYYKGDFKDVSFEEAERYSKEIFSIIVKDQELKYDNRDEINAQKYIFRTYLEKDFTTPTPIDQIDYTVEYNKDTKEVSLQAVSYRVPSRTHNYKETELDAMVNELVDKFNTKAFNYEKKINYDDENNIEDIRYSYIEKTNGVYDEMKKIDIVIQPHGLVSSFKLIHSDNKEVILPKLSKEEIINKVNKEAEVTDVLLIRNIEGKVEYEVQLKYNNNLYSAVFDGNNGSETYYGRKLRNYDINTN